MIALMTDAAGRYHGEGGPHFFVPFIFLLLLGLLISRVARGRRLGCGPGGSSPMTTLQDRFARGEIDRSEFEHRRAVLKSDKNIPPAPPAAGARTMAGPDATGSSE